MNQLVKQTRRDAIRLFSIGGGIIAAKGAVAFTAAPGQKSPERAFMAAFEAPVDKPVQGTAARLAFLHDQALVIDHGAPFPMTKAGYADHLEFHMASLERSETRFHELQVVPHGDSAIVSAYFIERSKPKDAGFRLRAGYCTAVCTRASGDWKALSLHMSPLTSQVIDASPG
jgi:ketosteroid isomerase-like protein